MNLICIAALVAVCSAAKLDRTYLPPDTAKTAGGSSADLQTPNVREFQPRRSGLPKGAKENEFDGVVVEAAVPGTRASGQGDSGLGGSRMSYGSTHSKVGEAAFKVANQQRRPAFGQQNTQSTDTSQVNYQAAQHFQHGTLSHGFAPRPQAALERASSTVRFENNIGSEAYSYAYETENGITAEESGIAVNGVQAEGGYSYTGDDGKLYKITYTAGVGGYQPTGDHIPTPHPIPAEILRSLEQNAREAAAGFVDDGSYDDAKYNEKGENSRNNYFDSAPAFEKRPIFNHNVDGTFITNNNKPLAISTNELTSSSFSQQQSSGNNYDSVKTQGSNQESINSQIFDFPNQNTEIQGISSQNLQIESNLMTGFTGSDKNIETNEKDDQIEFGDYSRPISFGPTIFNQFPKNQVGTKQTYLHPSNSFAFNELPSTVPSLSPSRSTVQQKLSSVPVRQSSNTLPSILSTMQPIPVLTLPLEHSLINNQQANSLQNKIISSHDFQASNNNAAKIQSTDLNLQVGQYDLQSGSHNFLQENKEEKQSFNHQSQYQPTQDHSYYYDLPVNSFNANSAQMLPTFVSIRQKDRFITPTKYPSPPTVAPIVSDYYQKYSTFNTNLGILQESTFITQNEGSKASTKYPQPPTLGLIVPTPTRPTNFGSDDVFTQHSGITQASASPFPSISPPKYTSTHNSPKTDSNSDKLLEESNLQHSPNIRDQNISNFNTMGSQETPTQEYDGEIYEYNKPMDTLASPAESDKQTQPSDFSQFGQKIKPSTTDSNRHQFDRVQTLNERNNDQRYPSIQELTVGSKEQFESNKFQSVFNSQSSDQGLNDNRRQPFGPSNNVPSTGYDQATQMSLLSTGASPEIESNADLKNPFGFSSVIRPCCQGYTKTPIAGTANKNFQQSNSFLSQNINQRPELESTAHFEIKATERQSQEKLHSAQGTSQTFTAADQEQFDKSRKPPNFNDEPGYHY